MATSGLAGDVNNTIMITNAYPVGRTFGMIGQSPLAFSQRNNLAGEIGGLNQDYARASMQQTNASMVSTQSAVTPGNGNGNGNGPKPAIWWLTFAIVFVIIAWTARKFAPDGEQFAIIKPNLINGLFLTLWIVLIIVFLKQIALRVRKVPFVGTAADLVLSV
jgi:hypothetical protein